MTSSSSVSRRFVAATRDRVEAYMSRPLDAPDLPVILMDGTGFDGDHVLVTAVGIDREGTKHVLGVNDADAAYTLALRARAARVSGRR